MARSLNRIVNRILALLALVLLAMSGIELYHSHRLATLDPLDFEPSQPLLKRNTVDPFALGMPGYLEPEWEWARNVSIVFTWVNGTDPAQIARKSEVFGRPAKADNRDRDMDELRYSIRSIVQYMPWHTGTIYIVSPGQVPDWIDTSNPLWGTRIRVVDQAEILPAAASPTFNSNLIEFYLDRIPNLTNHFIQFNDDYFLAGPVYPHDYFTVDGRVRFFKTPMKVSVTREVADERFAKFPKRPIWLDQWQHSFYHTSASLKEVFRNDKLAFQNPQHAPYAWRREFFAPVRFAFREYIEPMYPHKVRDPKDVVPPVAHQTYVEQLANFEGSYFEHVGPTECKRFIKFFKLTDDSAHNAEVFEDIRTSQGLLFYNINDDMAASSPSTTAQDALAAFMTERYPFPSAFEVDTRSAGPQAVV
jgi:hypothetical protein